MCSGCYFFFLGVDLLSAQLDAVLETFQVRSRSVSTENVKQLHVDRSEAKQKESQKKTQKHTTYTKSLLDRFDFSRLTLET